MRGAIGIKPGRTICAILDLKSPVSYSFIGPEESVVLDALLPEVFALVPLVKVELNDVLVVALWRFSDIMIQMGGKMKVKDRNRDRQDLL